MVSVFNSTVNTITAGGAIPWQNGVYSCGDRSSSGSSSITLNRCGYYSIDFDASLETTVADTDIQLTMYLNGVISPIADIVATTAANSPVHSGFNTVIRVTNAPATITVVSDSDITLNKAQLKAIHL